MPFKGESNMAESRLKRRGATKPPYCAPSRWDPTVSFNPVFHHKPWNTPSIAT